MKRSRFNEEQIMAILKEQGAGPGPRTYAASTGSALPPQKGGQASRIARNIAAQLLERSPQVPVIHMGTHNDNDYSDDNDRVCRNFETMLDEIDLACREAGPGPVGATFADVVAMIHDVGQRRQDFAFADATMLTD